MTQKQIKKTGEIAAVDDKGNRYTIIKYTEVFTTRGFGDDSSETAKGYDIYQLPDGEPVNQISETEFFAVLSEITLHVSFGLSPLSL